MIHQYKSNGFNIVMDVESSSIHLVDDVTYDVISLYEEKSADEILEELKGAYDEDQIRESLSEIEELVDQKKLFTEDVFEPVVGDFKKHHKPVVKALCMHIAHDCNLACKYCFAEEGEYHGKRELMSFETGKKALDYLVQNSGNRVNLEVDFFGGEPLMNWDVVKQLVQYGRSIEEANNKKFRFTLTTNGVLLNDEVQDFLNKEMGNVVISLDGRKEVNDNMRPFRNGKGSYDLIVPKFQKLAESRRVGIVQIAERLFITGQTRDRKDDSILCGGRAMRLFAREHMLLTRTANFLTTSADNVPESTMRLKNENTSLKAALKNASIAAMEMKAAALPAGEYDACLFEKSELTGKVMQETVNRMTEKISGYCGLFCGNDEEGYRFVVGSRKKDSREMAKILREQFGACGGGKPEMVQGSVHAEENKIRELFD